MIVLDLNNPMTAMAGMDAGKRFTYVRGIGPMAPDRRGRPATQSVVFSMRLVSVPSCSSIEKSRSFSTAV
jgi:hypothetical protein